MREGVCIGAATMLQVCYRSDVRVFITTPCVYYSSTYYKAVRVGVLKLFPGPFGTAVSNDEIRGTF